MLMFICININVYSETLHVVEMNPEAGRDYCGQIRGTRGTSGCEFRACG